MHASYAMGVEAKEKRKKKRKHNLFIQGNHYQKSTVI